LFASLVPFRATIEDIIVGAGWEKKREKFNNALWENLHCCKAIIHGFE